MDEPERRGNSFGRAFLAALVWVPVFVLLGVVLVSASGDGVDAGGVGEVVGAFLVSALLAALPTWLITRRKPAWAFWKLALLALPFFLLFRLISVAGQAS